MLRLRKETKKMINFLIEFFVRFCIIHTSIYILIFLYLFVNELKIYKNRKKIENIEFYEGVELNEKR